jgi:hypothetical protein
MRTPDERAAIASRSKFDFGVPNEELTNRTFSLSIDAGMYLAEVFRSQYPHLEWHQPLQSKRYVDYGQLVLVGFGKVPMNPVRIMVSLSYGILSGKQDGHRLSEVYSYWSKQASAV